MNRHQAIKDNLAAPVEIVADRPFSAWGGVIAARKLFGDELNGMLDESGEGRRHE